MQRPDKNDNTPESRGTNAPREKFSPSEKGKRPNAQYTPSFPSVTVTLGRISDLGGDPNEMSTARERTWEERVLAQKVREFRTDEWLTQEQKNRINKTPADGRAKLRAEFEKDFKRELKVLQTKAVESRKRQRLRESGERKIAKGEARRLEQIKILHDQGEDVTTKLEELDRIKKGLPTAVRHRLEGNDIQFSQRKTRIGRQNEVNRRLLRTRELAEGHEGAKHRAWLRRSLKRFGTQSEPKLKGLSEDMRRGVRERIRVALDAAKHDTAEETIERMAKPEGMEQQAFEETARDFAGLLQQKNKDYGRIEAAYFAVQDLIREGKYSMKAYRESRKAQLDELAWSASKQLLQAEISMNGSETSQSRSEAKPHVCVKAGEDAKPRKPIPEAAEHHEKTNIQITRYTPQIACTCLLLLAFNPDNPYGYYMILRWVVCISFIYLSFEANKAGRKGWIWIFGGVASLYNPIITTNLGRELWGVVNLATVLLLAISVFILRTPKKAHADPKTMKCP